MDVYLLLKIWVKILVELQKSLKFYNNLVTNEEENIEYNREIRRERHIYLEQRDRIIDDLRLI